MKVLIIEDEVGILELYRRFLDREGYDVVTANNGLEGVTAVENDKFDLIITDLNMPGLSGAESIRRISKIDPKVPVIITTGFSDSDIAKEIVRHPSVVKIYSKPVKLQELLAAVKDFE